MQRHLWAVETDEQRLDEALVHALVTFRRLALLGGELDAEAGVLEDRVGDSRLYIRGRYDE